MSDPTEPAIPPLPLSKEPFLKGVRTYRNRRTLNLVVSLILFSIPCFTVVIAHLTHNSTGGGRTPVIPYIGAGILGIAIINQLLKCIFNVQEPVEIAPEGVRTKDNFWYWPQVKSVTPKKVAFADQYFFRIDLNVAPKLCILMPDPAPSQAQCTEILFRLKSYLAANHPAVTVQDVPR